MKTSFIVSCTIAVLAASVLIVAVCGGNTHSVRQPAPDQLVVDNFQEGDLNTADWLDVSNAQDRAAFHGL